MGVLAATATLGREPGRHGTQAVDPFYSVAPWPGLFTNLNILARSRAHQLLVASKPDPLGAVRALVLSGDAAVRVEESDPRTLLTIYTDTTRLRARVTHLDHGEGRHVLNARLSFRTDNVDGVRILADAVRIPEAEYRAADGRSGGMRHARVITALSPEGETVIESGSDVR